MLLKSVFVLTSVIIVVLAAYLYTPLPSGIKEPWKCQVLMMIIGFGRLMARTLTYVGRDTYPRNLRAIMELGMHHNYMSSWFGDVEVTKETLGDIPAVIYRPKLLGDKLAPAMVFFHGGGFIVGCSGTYDMTTYTMSKGARAVVVSVDYRRAPDYVFPAAVEDSIAATKYILRHGKELGIDVTKVGVVGDSAGGNLAASVALYLSKDNSGLPPLKFQLLFYPFLQAVDLMLPSYLDNNEATPNLIHRNYIAHLVSLYLGLDRSIIPALASNFHVPEEIRETNFSEHIGVHLLPREFRSSKEKPKLATNSTSVDLYRKLSNFLVDPLFSPLMADDVSKVPPAFVHVAEFDVLRDDGLLYVSKLQKAGVRVQGYVSEGGYHGEVNRLFAWFMQSNSGEDALHNSFEFMHDILGY